MFRNTFLLLAFLAIGFQVQAQAPNGLNYQGVIRDASGDPLANTFVLVRFTIHESAATGTVVYEEFHSPNTDERGGVALVIGNGSGVSGSLAAVDWGDHAHFLQVEVNIGGGYQDIGTMQFMSVPYALHAATAANADPSDELQSLSKTGNQISLSQGGGTVDIPWSQNGTDVYYDGGQVGIGTINPTSTLEVIGNDNTARMAVFEKSNTANLQDVLEVRTQAGAPDGAQFIEFQRGSTIEAQINTDGSANFKNVTVEDDLASNVTPVTGRVYANGLPVAYGYVINANTTPSLATDFGISGISRTGTGSYAITMNNTIAGEPVIIATSYSTAPNDEIVTASRISSQLIEVNIVNNAGIAVDSNFYFVVFGNTN